MTPAGSLARDLGRFYAEAGEQLLLRRPLNAELFQDLECCGVVVAAEPVQLPSGVWQIRRRVRLSNAEIAATGWPGPPRRDDWLHRRADGARYSVLDCDTRGLSGVAAVHILTVLGDL